MKACQYPCYFNVRIVLKHIQENSFIHFFTHLLTAFLSEYLEF